MPTLQSITEQNGVFIDGDWILSENMDVGGKYGVIQLKHVGIGQFYQEKDFNFISEKTFKALNCTEVFPGDILISRMADPIGRACIVPKLPFPCVTAVDVTIVRLNENIADGGYVMHLCNSDVMRQKVDRAVRGTTRARITRTELGQIEFPLPPLTEQTRIASLLARADRLRQVRRTAHDLGDELLQSVFLEMFGDVAKNEKDFDVFPFEELSTRITKGESPNWQGFSYEESGVLFITSENVLWGSLDISNPKYISEKFHNKLKRSKLAKDDLLINLVGASIGRAALVTEYALPANINQAVATVSIDTTKLNPFFALYQILNPYKQNQLLGNIVESARANISLTNIAELNLIVPPLSLQEEFAGVVRQVEGLRARMSEAERQVEGLFESLLAQSFSS